MMNGEGVPNIVVASNRPERINKFLEAWYPFLKGCLVHIVWDLPTKDGIVIKYPVTNGEILDIITYDYINIDRDLGDKAWIIPRKSSAIKSYGFYKAWQNKPLFIYTLDDDVLPPSDGSNPLTTIYKRLSNTRNLTGPRWLSTTKDFLPRGTSRGDTFIPEVKVVHGMWENIPDYESYDQVTGNSESKSKNDYNDFYVPEGSIISMCGMNLAFAPEITKFMYFGLQGTHTDGSKFPVRRCDDIMAGIYVKKKLDEIGLRMYSGEPYCVHTRASNIWGNYKDDTNNFSILNEWEALVWDNQEPLENKEYFKTLSEAYKIWEGLFESSPRV